MRAHEKPKPARMTSPEEHAPLHAAYAVDMLNPAEPARG